MTMTLFPELSPPELSLEGQGTKIAETKRDLTASVEFNTDPPRKVSFHLPVMRVSLVRERTLGAATKRISGPQDVYNILSDLLHGVDREHLVAILLDTKNVVLAVNTVSVGDLSSSIVHPREFFKPACLAGAASVIAGHNHPSGDPTPSAEDVTVTKRLMQAGEILGIDLLDHVVLGDGKFVSLKERGLI